MSISSVHIHQIETDVFRVPTEFPESDGTLAWDSTTLVVVRARAGDKTGIGYTYGASVVEDLIRNVLADVVKNRDAMGVSACWAEMMARVRNLGKQGIAAMAISAVDSALWDLKARLLDLPLVTLLGGVRESVPIYGSGGFTSYSETQLRAQLEGWAAEGIPRVKMKVGRDSRADVERVRIARKAIGNATELFVDANGAYSRKEALARAEQFAEMQVTWFEEPVSSDDLDGLRLLRDRAPAGMDVAAGEYGYDLAYFRRMVAAGAVDVLQADATRCGGITGFLKVAALCEANNLPLSAHTAPCLHTHVGCAAAPLRHVEYFHDHVRIEQLFFNGITPPINGELRPDLSRPGMGIELKNAGIQRYAA